MQNDNDDWSFVEPGHDHIITCTNNHARVYFDNISSSSQNQQTWKLADCFHVSKYIRNLDFKVSRDEIKKFFATVVHMGMIQKRSIYEYWSTNLYSITPIFHSQHYSSTASSSNYYDYKIETILQFILNLKSLRKLAFYTQTSGTIKSVLSKNIICEKQLPQLTTFTLENGYYNLKLCYNNLSTTNTIKRLNINCEMNDLTAIFSCSKSLKYLNIYLSDGWTYESWTQRGKPSLPALPTLGEFHVRIKSIPFDDLSNTVKAMPNVELVEITGWLNDGYCYYYDVENLKHLLLNIKTVIINKLDYRKEQSINTFQFVNDEYWYNVICEKVGEHDWLTLSAMGGNCRN